MKKTLFILLFILLAVSFAGSASAMTFIPLEDWKFNPVGVGESGVSTAQFSSIDGINFFGYSYVDNASSPFGPTTYSEHMAFSATSFYNGTPLNIIDAAQSGLSGEYELTGVTSFTGASTPTGPTTLNVEGFSGFFELYVNSALDFETTSPGVAPFMGADNGTPIAQFEFMASSNPFDFATDPPSMSFEVPLKVLWLAPNVWFDKDGNDLSSDIANLVGVVDAKAYFLSGPNDGSWFGEYSEKTDSPISPADLLNPADPAGSGNDFFLLNEGTLQIGHAVPAPSAITLLFPGLLALVGWSRRR